MSSANVSTRNDLDSGIGYEYLRANSEQKKAIRANATSLEEDEWETLDDTVYRVAQETLSGIQDLRSAGLTRSISLATQIDKWQTTNDFEEAQVDMSGTTEGENQRTAYTSNGVPVPIVHSDFQLSMRELESSRNMGDDLETLNAAKASRQVSEGLEDLLFNGWDAVTDGNSNTFNLYGYLTHPDRNTVSGSDFGTASNVRPTIEGIAQTLSGDNYAYDSGRGVWFYLNSEQYDQLLADDPDNDSSDTLLDTMESTFSWLNIRRADKVPAGTGVAVKPQPEVVDLSIAEDIQTVQWEEKGGMSLLYKVMGAMAPRLKSDYDGQMGVVEVTGI